MSNDFNPYQMHLVYQNHKDEHVVSNSSSSKPTTYYNSKSNSHSGSFFQTLGLGLIIFSLGSLFAAFWPFIKLDVRYLQDKIAWAKTSQEQPVQPESTFNPLIGPDGKDIEPVNKDFSIIIPTIGVNASIIAGVNPVSQPGYNKALLEGVAHASTSYYPNENGTVHLFSHSTNYEWFVKDLNAVFYLLKNLKPDDLVVIFYLGNRYTYTIRESKVVSAKDVSYLTPQRNSRNLILQTCWPPGSSYQRLLFFADLIEEKVYGKFSEITQ